jgi:predicted Rossmann fold flavoprotein
MRHIAVVGGGPAGFMAAIAAAETGTADPGTEDPGVAVTVFDAGIPLATVLRTGGGRCNLTNAAFETRELAGCYPRGGKLLLSIFSRFGPVETIAWFCSHGLDLVEEGEGRVFPRSGRAEDVRRLLETEARRVGIMVRAQAAVVGISARNGTFHAESVRGSEEFDRLIIATGGDWRNREGSGYRLARLLGHSVTPLAPSLMALAAAEGWAGRCAGLSFAEARAAWREPGGAAATEEGGLLFTHRGISGPLAFRVSARSAFSAISRKQPLALLLSILPGMDAGQIERRLRDLFSERPRQKVVSAVRALVPRSLAEVIVQIAGLDPECAAAQLSRDGRKQLAALLDRLPLTIVGREPGTEMVTAGGIPLGEIDPRTMGSRLVPGLYFCGEVLDIDGFTGGFNLQAAWTTGRLAGLAAGR